MTPTLIQTGPRQATYRRLAAFCAMLAVAMVYRADYLTDWDSWDYAAQAIQGHSSDLLLGRWWFIAVMRVAYLLSHAMIGFDSTPEQSAVHGVMAMQAFSAIMMAGALVALMAWTNRLTKSVGAELLVVALVLPGPMIGLYASSVMTESLTVLTLSLAFLAWEAAIGRTHPHAEAPHLVGVNMLAFLAGCAFGIAIDVREPAALFCFWPILSCIKDRPEGRWRLLSLAVFGAVVTLGMGVAGGYAWYPWMKRTYFENMVSWTSMMASERQQFSVSLWGNLNFLFKYAMATDPVPTMLALPAIALSLIRRSRLGWLGLACVPYTLSLLVNHDLGVNPRFLIPLLWMLIPVVAGTIAAVLLEGRRWYRPKLAVICAGLLVWGISILWSYWGHIEDYYFHYARTMNQAYESVLRDVPDGSTIIPGPATPVVMHINRLKLRDYDLIRSGWTWPGKGLKAMIDRRLAGGRNVYINVRKDDWEEGARKSPEWDDLMQAIQGCELCPETYPMVRILPPPASQPTSAATTTSKAQED